MNRFSRRGPDPKILEAIEALKSHRPAEAIRLLSEVIQQKKRDPQLWFLLSSAYSQQGNTQEVIRLTRKVLEMVPRHVGALCGLGGAYAATGQQQQSLRCFQEALRLAPRDPGVHLSFAEVLLRDGHTEGAISHFNAVLQLKPDFSQAHKRLGHIHWSVGHLDLAENHYKQACRIDPSDMEALNGCILTVGHGGRLDEALGLLDKALVAAPNDPELLATKAHLLLRDGQYKQSFEVLKKITRGGITNPVSAATLVQLCRRFDCCDMALATAEKLLKNPGVDAASKRLLYFAVGGLMDKLGRYEEAFPYFQKANQAVPLRFDSDSHEKYITSMKETFSREKFSTLPLAGNADKRPIFIVGMPRSGTTLVEQILASHPDVYGAGELGDIIKLTNGLQDRGGEKYPAALANLTHRELDSFASKYLQKLDSVAPGASRITDKMPQNFLHLGLISRAFPGATIIHCRRNPLDTCLSIYFQNFSWGYDWAADLANIGQYYLQYDRLLRHWERVLDIPILHVQYEELVTEQKEWTRRLLVHCGLEWHDDCLDFHKTKRWVTTASYDQVREKMYTSSVARWRNYEANIEPLLRALAPIMPPIGA